MDTKENLGFMAMASFDSKLTVVEGVLLGSGAVIALTAAHLASRSLAEVRKRPPMPFTSAFSRPGTRSVEQVMDVLEKDVEVAAIFIKFDQDSGPNSRFNKQDRRIRLEKYAKVIASTDLDERGLVALLKGGAGDLVLVTGDEEKLEDMKAVAMLAKRPPEQIKWIFEAAHTLNPYTYRYEGIWDFFRDFEEIHPEEFEEAKKIYEIVFSAAPSQPRDPIASTVKLLRGGFSPDEVKKLGRAAAVLAVRWDHPEIGQAAREILKKYSAEEIKAVARYLKSDQDVLNFLDLGLESIPDEKYEIYPRRDYSLSGPPGYQWDRYATDVRDLQQAPKALFEKANIPLDEYLGYWRAFQKNDDVKSAVYTLAAAGEAIPSKSAKEMLRYLAKRLGASFNDDSLSYNLLKMEKLAKALKSGLLQKLDKTIIEHSLKTGGEGDTYLSTTYEDKFLDLIDHIDKIKDWKSYGDLSEQLAVATGQYSSERSSKELSEEQKILRRSRDRLAQRDPEWAISEFPAEYKRGRRIAKFLEEITDHVEDLVNKGDVVVIHGRDGELLYDLLMRRPGIDKSKIRYALTSRPMTTQAQFIPEVYKDYLGRMVPKNAVHIDTGFAGSIPRWLDAQGYQIKAIRMVSATNPEEQIPVSIPISNEERREIVLSDLEHSSQRLENPTQYRPASSENEPESGGFRGLVYSWAAPGFHARAYGVYDELGLPRLMAKTPRTRFEERQKFRIAPEEPEVEDVVEEMVAKKVLK